MKERKDIDNLFQERFENFEATPSPEVWEKIRVAMKKEEKDRKVIPFWWKAAGVAALIALLFTIGNTFFDSGTTTPDIVIQEPAESIPSSENTPEGYIEADDNPVQLSTEASQQQTDDASDKDNLIRPGSGHSTEKVEEEKVTDANNYSDPVAAEKKSVNQKARETVKDPIKRSEHLLPKEPEAGIGVTKENNNNLPRDIEGNKNPSVDKQVISDTKTEEAITITPQEKKDPSSEKEDLTVPEPNKRSIFDAIDEADDPQEAIAKVPVSGPRWEVTPNAGPVYYSSFGQGSSIDPAFADNSQSGDVNFSYGLQVSYAVNDRLSVRSGINSVKLGYSTGGIELGTGPVSAAIQSIDYGNRSVVLTAVDKGSLTHPSGGNPYDNITPKSTNGEATLIQNINYYEIPLEARYAILNTRFGIHMIGGFSTLLLGDNQVSVSAGDFSGVLGEANNLNSVSFTTNVGLGFDYRLSRKLKFNIEPMFKYQLNPYSDSSVDFKPYYLGVYTGLSFKF